MRRLRLALLLASAALAGCAAVGRPPPDRANGQPGLLPCMIGDALCK